MALSLDHQKALDALPPPASLERITQFLNDLGTQGSTPLGAAGRSAQNFAASFGGAQSFSARQTSGWVAILMDRYQIKMLEIQDFALWFVRRQEIFAETSETVERVPELAERAPESALARLPMRAVRTASMAALAVAAPSAAFSAVPAGPEALASVPESVSAPSAEAPRKSLRRLPVAPPTETKATAESEDASPEATADPLTPRRLTASAAGSTPRLRRIERISSPTLPEPADAPPEPLSEDGPLSPKDTPPSTKRTLGLTPQMITRPAFVTNIGLAGLLTGMSLAPTQAAPLMASPAMNLASPLLPNIGPTLGAPPSLPAAVPLGTPAFAPTVTPMSVPAASLSVPSAALGQIPTLGRPSSLGRSAALGDAPSIVPPVFTTVAAPASALASPAAICPAAGPSQSGLFSVGSVSADSPPQAAEGMLSVKKAPLLLGLAAGSAGLLAASRFFGAPVVGTPTPESPSAAGTAPVLGIAPPPGQPRLGVSGFRQQIPAAINDPTDVPPTAGVPTAGLPNGALPNAALSPMTLFTGQAASAERSAEAGNPASPPEPPVAVTPEMGQITLIAPPLQVASVEAERSGMAASLDWKTLAGGAGRLDEGSLARLKPALPASAGLLYPALPPGRLGAGAVNLPLSAPLVQSLLQKSYGSASAGLASRAADLGSAAFGGAPAARPLPAQIVPGKRPMGASAGVLGHSDEQKGGAGALAEAGQGQAKRGGVMDFLGLPVRLAPSLSGGPELARETAVRTAGSGPVRSQQTLRPDQFAPLRNRLFPAFHSMAAEPNESAWRQAAPAFGLRDGKPTTVLSPDARVPVQTPTSPQPAVVSQPSASSRPLSLIPRPLPGFLGSHLPSGVSQALGHSVGGGFGNIASNLAQARPHSSNSGFGSIPSGASPAIGRSGGVLGGIPSGVSQALGHSVGSGFGNIASGLAQARPHSGSGVLSGIPSGISQGLGHSGIGGFGGIVSGASQAFGYSGGVLGSGGSFGNIASGLARPRSGNGGFGGLGSGASQVFGRSGGVLGAISSGMPQALGHSGGGGFGNIASGLAQAHPRSGNRGFGSIPSGLSQTFGHSGGSLGHMNSGTSTGGGHLPLRHPTFTTSHHGNHAQPTFTSAGSAKPSINLAAPRTASSRFMPSQIVRPSSKIVNFGPAPKSPGTVPAMRFVTPRSSARSASDSGPPMTIQRSETTTTVTPARNEGAKTQARAAAAPQGGAASSEVNALAGEVWSLLKRRLANEAERRGRW